MPGSESKLPVLGDGHPTFNRNPYNGYIKPYYWVDFPISNLEGTNVSLQARSLSFKWGICQRPGISLDKCQMLSPTLQKHPEMNCILKETSY